MRRWLIPISLAAAMIAIAMGVAWRRDVYGVQGAWTATSTVGMYGSIEHIRAVPAYLQGRRAASFPGRFGRITVA